MATWKKVIVSGSHSDLLTVTASQGLMIGDASVTSTAAELNILDGVNSTASELNLVDGSAAGTIVNSKAVIYGSAGEVNATTFQIAGTDITSTAAEINLIDGGTARGTTAIADGDGFLTNDGGTMRMTKVETLATYISGKTVGGTGIVTTGVLNAGSINTGFGNINNGASTITTTGLISGGSLDIDNVLINGTTIGHTDDTDLMTVADGLLTVAGEVQMTTLDIGGTNVTATAAEINLIDGDTARGTTAVADGDGILTNDGGTMRMTNVQTFATYFGAEISSQRMVVADIVVASLTGDNIVTIPHNLGTADVMVQVYDKTTEANVICDIARTSEDFSTPTTEKISIDFGTPPPNDCRVLITSLASATASGTVTYA